MVKKIVKNIFICLLLFSSCVSFVYASSKLCNISIYSHINNDNDEVTIIKDSFNLYKIADYKDGEYINVDNFKNIKIALTDMSSSKVVELASELKAYTIDKKLEPDLKSSSNDKGYAYFKNLDQGIYLIYQSKDDSEYLTNPILLSVPYEKDGSLVYDINIDAKYVDKDVTVDENIISSNNVDHVTNTSDTTNLDMWILISASSLIVLILLGTYYSKSNKS